MEVLSVKNAASMVDHRLWVRRDARWGPSYKHFLKDNRECAERYVRDAISDAVALSGEYSEAAFRFVIQLRGLF